MSQPENPSKPASTQQPTGLNSRKSDPRILDDELSDDDLGGISGGKARPAPTAAPSTTRGNARSDMRLKHDIERLTHAGSIPLYRFKYLDDDSQTDWVGVMAQDLLDHPQHKAAVSLCDEGFYRVDYAALGLEMERYEDWLKH